MDECKLLGNGMILLRLAKDCEHFIGTDLSTTAVEYVRGIITTHPDFLLPHCVLDIAGAHEARRFEDQRLDTVVCNGRTVLVEPVKPMLKAPGTQRWKLKYDELPSNFAFKFNLRL